MPSEEKKKKINTLLAASLAGIAGSGIGTLANKKTRKSIKPAGKAALKKLKGLKNLKGLRLSKAGIAALAVSGGTVAIAKMIKKYQKRKHIIRDVARGAAIGSMAYLFKKKIIDKKMQMTKKDFKKYLSQAQSKKDFESAINATKHTFKDMHPSDVKKIKGWIKDIKAKQPKITVKKGLSGKEAMQAYKKGAKGRWVTVNGRKIFIPEGKK